VSDEEAAAPARRARRRARGLGTDLTIPPLIEPESEREARKRRQERFWNYVFSLTVLPTSSLTAAPLEDPGLSVPNLADNECPQRLPGD